MLCDREDGGQDTVHEYYKTEGMGVWQVILRPKGKAVLIQHMINKQKADH